RRRHRLGVAVVARRALKMGGQTTSSTKSLLVITGPPGKRRWIDEAVRGWCHVSLGSPSEGGHAGVHCCMIGDTKPLARREGTMTGMRRTFRLRLVVGVVAAIGFAGVASTPGPPRDPPSV